MGVQLQKITGTGSSPGGNNDVTDNAHLRVALVPSLVFILGLLISTATGWYWHLHNQEVVSAQLAEITDEAEQLVQDRFALYEYGLRAMRGTIITAGPDKLNRSVIERYIASREQKREFPGARGFGFIRLVPKNETDNFIAAAKDDGRPDFALRELNAHDGDRFIIQYIYPNEGNEGATGLDIASERNRRAAAITAAQTGEVRLTEPITLVQADGKVGRGFLILLPVYNSDLPMNSQNDRLSATLGWSYAPLVVDEVLGDLGIAFRNISMSLTDGIDQEPFFISDTNDQRPIVSQTEERNIQVHGRNWVLRTQPLPSMYQSLNLFNPWQIGLIGFVISALATGLLWWLNLKKSKSGVITTGDQVSLGQFFKTPLTISILLFAVAMVVSISAVSGFYLWYVKWQNVSNQLLTQSSEASLGYESGYADYQLAARFLSTSFETLDLFQTKIAVSEANSDQYSDWQTQVANSLSAFMLSSAPVTQARVIGLAENGKELVRVQYRNGQIYITPNAELQEKGSEPYMKAAAELAHASVWVSDITLNRENGKIELPEVPTVRFVAPIYTPSGEIFGAVVLNVDWRRFLKETNAYKPGNLWFILNSNGDFLLHPEPSMNFAFERRDAARWDDLYSKANLPWGVEKDLNAWLDSSGDELIVSSVTVSPNPRSTTGEVVIVYAKPKSEVLRDIYKPLVLVIILAAVFGTVLVFLYYFYWKRGLRERIIQEQLASAERVRSQEGLIRGVLGFAPEAMIVSDEEGNVFFANQQTLELFEYSVEEIIGKPCEIFIERDFREQFRDTLQAQFLSEGPRTETISLELSGKKRSGSNFPATARFAIVEFENKPVVVMSFRDLTEEILAKEILTDAKEAAEQASVAKGAFMANISHEIRTPLNAVLGLSTLLLDGKASEEQRDYLNKINLAGRSLLGIVNNVLDLSKIEAGEMALDEVEFVLHDQLTDLSKIYETQAQISNLEFTLEMAPNLPGEVVGDSNRLGQILTNLVGNAIKFTEAGSVKLSAEALSPALEGSSDTVLVRFSVTDTGIGIPSEKQEKLFKPFSQADSSTSRRFGGTGLGLSIVNQLVVLMGGRQGFESEEGKGSRFWVELPFRRVDQNTSVVQGASSSPLLVFLVEDNETERLQLTNLILSLGWSVVSLTSGLELVEEYLHRAKNNLKLPDVLIVDWQLPGLDGLAALERLADEVGHEKLPAALMISVFDREKIAAIDTDKLVDQIITKPIDGSLLFNAVNDIVSERTGSHDHVLEVTKTEALEANWLPDVKTLVVDDSRLNLEVATHLLQNSGAIVTAVESGEQCLAILRARPDEFDVVLMDVQMPQMDGYETTRRIRGELGLVMLPILALTAGALIEERKLAQEAGMNDFLTKPIEPGQLIQRVRKAVEHVRSEAIPVRPRDQKLAVDQIEEAVHKLDQGTTASADVESTLPNYTLPVWDHQIALELTGGNEGLLKRLASLYAPQVREHMAIVQTALENNDADSASRSLHVLQGSSSQIGAQRVADAARQLENVTRQEGLDLLQQKITELAALVEETATTIEEAFAD